VTLYKWYSLGSPIIIESESKINKSKKSFFHFTQKGFYAIIKMLTNGQKISIIEEIKKVYNISIEMHQIIELKPNKFECELEINGDTEDEISILQGSVVSFKSSFQLKLEFRASNNEQNWMKNYLPERIEDLEFYCEISSKENSFENYQFKLNIQLKNPVHQKYDCFMIFF
jgi:predicted transcriptional regulator